jgi:hypothetical protein
MTAYLLNAPSGFQGDCSRPDESSIEPSMLITPFPANFGVAMKYTPGGVTPMIAADAASVFAGVLVRSVPGISQSNTAESVNTFQPDQVKPNGLGVRGYFIVKVNAGTPVRGTAVGIVQTASGGHPAGSFEVATTGNNVPLTGTLVGNVTWASDGVDANGMGEIRIAQ